MKLKITIEGKTYEVGVEVMDDEEDRPHPETHRPVHAASVHAPSRGGAWDAAGKICRSPVMGLVVKVNVRPGQSIEANAPVLALEAMKMETHITAPRAATVKAVHVKPGDPVKMNQVLVEFE